VTASVHAAPATNCVASVILPGVLELSFYRVCSASHYYTTNVALQQVSRPNKRKLITASKCAFFQQFVCVELGTFVSTFGGRRTAIRRVIFTLTNGSVYSIRTRVDRTVMRYRHHYNVIVKKTNLLSAERDGR